MAAFLPEMEDQMLARYLAGETDEQENAAIAAWLEEDEAHKRRLEAFRRIWEAGGSLESDKAFNTDAAWEKVRTKTVDKPAARIIPLWRRAAVWAGILLAAGAVWWQLRPSAPEMREFAAVRSGDSLILADATVIKAYAGSSISYPERFDGKERRIRLRGEAFFKVAHDSLHPFHVETRRADIQVLGTEFNVRETDSITTVYVKSGRVKVSSGGGYVILTKGQSASISGDQAPVMDETSTGNELGYLTGRLQFRNAGLEEVAASLRHRYGIKLRVEVRNPGPCSISTTFAGERPEQVMEVLCATLGLSWSLENGTYVLKGEGCK